MLARSFFCAEKDMIKIILSGDIGWEISAEKIRKQLNDASGQDLEIQIASPGGSVFEGLEIYNLFRDYKRDYPSAQLLATIKGEAASMASYLAMNPAFDILAAEDNAVMMIHNAWGGVVGDYREVFKMAEVLDGVTNIIGQAYTARTKIPLNKIRDMMNEETWLFGSEIKDAGFVDEIVGTEEPKDKAVAITQSKLRFSALSKKLVEAKIDLTKIAAHNPAPNAGKNTMEVQVMTTLQELLSQNPAAKAEYDAALQAKFEAGKREGDAAVEAITARVSKAAPFVGNAEYPAKVTELAIAAIKGEKSIDALETTVSTLDAIREQSASTAAADESAAAAGTHAEQTPEHSEMCDQIQRDKIALGLEVK